LARDLVDPRLEQRPCVVRARARFRMELERARVQVGEVEALDGLVVERDVRRLLRVRCAHGEAVVLARDEHPAAVALQYRMIRAAVTERELEGLVTRRE